MRKRLIHTWTRKASNLVQNDRFNFWGIGDLLRGSNVLFELCKDLDIDYELDISHHPISLVLSPSDNKFKNGPEIAVPFYLFQNMDDAKVQVCRLLEQNHTVVFNSSGYPFWPTQSSVEWREWIKKIIVPPLELKRSIKKFLPASKYNVFHFRLGDHTLVRGKGRFLIRPLFALVRYSEPEDLVISDSENFKRIVRLLLPRIKVSNASPVHTGLSSNSKLLDQTLLDFFAIAGAMKVKTFSEYPGASGFVVSACRIFEVPMIEIDPMSLRKMRYVKLPYMKFRKLWKSLHKTN